MNTLVVRRRWSNDGFTYDLFKKISETYDINGLFIYTHHTDFRDTPDLIVSELHKLINNYNHKIIVIGIKDHHLAIIPHKLLELCQLNEDKKFVLVVSPENLKSRLQVHKNILDVFSWGGDWTNQIDLYRKSDIVVNKQLQKFIFTYFFKNSLPDRQIILSIIFGLDLAAYGLMPTRHYNDPRGHQVYSYDNNLYERNSLVSSLLLKGDAIAKDSIPNAPYDPEFLNTVYKHSNSNYENFEQYLIKFYEQTCIDVVGESSWVNESPFLTEKTLHSFFGKSMPIIISGKGVVQHCRDIGFDMFDDIIDHSYDLVDNRLERIYLALYNNRELLSNSSLAIEKYKSVDPKRFEHNINIIKTRLCEFYTERLNNMFKPFAFRYKLIQKLNKGK